VPEPPDANDPGESRYHLAKIRALGSAVAAAEARVRAAASELKAARSELAGARRARDAYLSGLDEPLPLFDREPAAGDAWRATPLGSLAGDAVRETAERSRAVREDLSLTGPPVIEPDLERMLEAESDADETPETVRAAKRAKAAPAEPPGVDGLFLVHRNRKKAPEYAVRAFSKLEAIAFVKHRHPDTDRMAVRADDGTAARLGVRILLSRKAAEAAPHADPGKAGADVPAGFVSCNRCFVVRPARPPAPCPACECPEYGVSPADRGPGKPAKAPRKRKAKTGGETRPTA
jgi:hypothetical protein